MEGRSKGGRESFNQRREAVKATPEEISFDEETAPLHLANLFEQLTRVFDKGEIDLRRIDELAHW
jgi:hypothetical protein